MTEYTMKFEGRIPGGIPDSTFKLQSKEIVRCRDCVHCYADDSVWMCAQLDFGIDYITSGEKPKGFCAWGERDSWITCKCGEEIELGDRESAVCPSCGRMVRE